VPPVEKAVPDEEAPTKVGASLLGRDAGLYPRTVALDQSVEIQRCWSTGGTTMWANGRSSSTGLDRILSMVR
jgi:hypothetical protein